MSWRAKNQSWPAHLTLFSWFVFPSAWSVRGERCVPDLSRLPPETSTLLRASHSCCGTRTSDVLPNLLLLRVSFGHPRRVYPLYITKCIMQVHLKVPSHRSGCLLLRPPWSQLVLVMKAVDNLVYAALDLKDWWTWTHPLYKRFPDIFSSNIPSENTDHDVFFNKFIHYARLQCPLWLFLLHTSTLFTQKLFWCISL